MKMGFVSAILDKMTFEEMIDTACDMGFECVEVACWPKGDAERRYAGVCHIDVDAVLSDEKYVDYILSYTKEKSVEISALAFYPNTMDGNIKKRNANISHLKKVVKASAKLDINMVTSFIGREQTETAEENLSIIREIWQPIIELAEAKGVRIAIENCPMLFGVEQWPGGQNLMTSPSLWRKIFEILSSDNLGLNYDPSHFVWQRMDYIKPIYEFSEKLFHIHFKDIKIHEDKLDDVGIMAYPLAFMSPKLPGLGEVEWDRFVSALTDVGYDGYACIEVEDRAFEETLERVIDSLKLSKRYMEQFVI